MAELTGGRPSYIFEKEFSTAREFLDHLLGGDYRPTRVIETLSAGQRGYVFRGQANWDWPLLPNAHRCSGRNLWSYAPQPPTFRKPKDAKQQRVFLGDHVFEEIYAVMRFLETADRLGIATPLDYLQLKLHSEHVHRLWNEEGEEAVSIAFPDERLLPAFALAQHHGVPTRLLDWTESPLVAAYFAAYEASSAVDSIRRIQSERIAVFVLHTDGLTKDDASVRLARAPRHQNSFLRVQKGLFTVVPHANQYFRTYGEWPAVPDVYGHTACQRLSLPADESDELLRLLFTFDMTPHHLMPTLKNAAQAVVYAQKVFAGKRS